MSIKLEVRGAGIPTRSAPSSQRSTRVCEVMITRIETWIVQNFGDRQGIGVCRNRSMNPATRPSAVVPRTGLVMGSSHEACRESRDDRLRARVDGQLGVDA